MIPAVLLLLLVWTTSAFAATAGSAILALRTVANQPYAADARIVELRGERADPMPAEWRILLAERTPLKGFQNVAEMAAIQTSQVSLDSSDLLQSVREQANEARVAFHWLDYTLHTDASTRKPVWTIRLYDDLGALAGTMGVSAEGGAIVQFLQMPDGSPLKKSPSKKAGGLLGKIADFTESTARKVGDTTLRTVGSVQEFLIGERTIGPKDEE